MKENRKFLPKWGKLPFLSGKNGKQLDRDKGDSSLKNKRLSRPSLLELMYKEYLLLSPVEERILRTKIRRHLYLEKDVSRVPEIVKAFASRPEFLQDQKFNVKKEDFRKKIITSISNIEEPLAREKTFILPPKRNRSILAGMLGRIFPNTSEIWSLRNLMAASVSLLVLIAVLFFLFPNQKGKQDEFIVQSVYGSLPVELCQNTNPKECEDLQLETEEPVQLYFGGRVKNSEKKYLQLKSNSFAYLLLNKKSHLHMAPGSKVKLHINEINYSNAKSKSTPARVEIEVLTGFVYLSRDKANLPYSIYDEWISAELSGTRLIFWKTDEFSKIILLDGNLGLQAMQEKIYPLAAELGNVDSSLQTSGKKGDLQILQPGEVSFFLKAQNSDFSVLRHKARLYWSLGRAEKKHTEFIDLLHSYGKQFINTGSSSYSIRILNAEYNKELSDNRERLQKLYKEQYRSVYLKDKRDLLDSVGSDSSLSKKDSEDRHELNNKSLVGEKGSSVKSAVRKGSRIPHNGHDDSVKKTKNSIYNINPSEKPAQENKSKHSRFQFSPHRIGD